ncbi:MAG: SAV_2336 N-terminal domain-related protein [Cyanobacteriota bacterium]
MADPGPLQQLLQWRLLLAEADGAAVDPCEIRDWLWLSAQLDGVALPRTFAAFRARASQVVDADPIAEDDPPPPFPEPHNPRITPAEPPGPDPLLPSPFPQDPPMPEAEEEPVARLLDERTLPDAADVEEALRERHGAFSVRVSEIDLLPFPLQVLQSLRPLLRRHPHPWLRVLDEERSANKSAETGLAWPVFRPRKLPQVTVRVVLDGGVSMAVWEPLALELQRILASSQAFRRVVTQRLKPSHLSAPDQGDGDGEEGRTTVILLLSDSAGHHWWNGSILPWLQRKARSQPVVLVHTLPQRYWGSTALSQAELVTFSNRGHLAPNSRYAITRRLSDPWDPPVPTDPEATASALRLPVISLDRRELAPWAALVAGEPRARCAGRVFAMAKGLDAPPAAEAPQADQEMALPAVERLWEEFASRASPEAQELLLAMAASTVLSLPIMRLLQAAEAPRAFSPQPLAEVLVSGLVRRLERPGKDLPPELPPDRLQFELVPAARRLLEPRLSAERRRQVLASVTDLLERHWNRQGTGTSFKALLLGPKEVLKQNYRDLFHLANVTAAMLDRLPGSQFRELAAQLRGRDAEALPPPSPWPTSMAFKEQGFDTAQLLEAPPLEPMQVATARFAAVELRRVMFTTATVTPTGKMRSWDDEMWAFHEPLQADRLSSGDKAERADPLTLTLVGIPAGEFWMGSPEGEEGSYGNEKPQHLVRLPGFFMGQTPITQAQWREVAGWKEREGERWGRELKANPSFFQWVDGKGDARLFKDEASTDGCPVEQVSWEEAKEFCSRLSQRTGRTYTLPSEAQWEYACRAGTTTPFAFGETLTAELANYNASESYASGPKGEWRKQTTPVGMFPANAWGLLDMHGNVWEWCLDEWHGSYEGAPEDGRAWRSTRRKEGEGEESQSAKDKERRGSDNRLLRGGSWFHVPRDCRSAVRIHNRPGIADSGVGFRVVCLPQGPSLLA